MTAPLALAAGLEAALDFYIRQDPQALQRCATLEGKCIELDVTGTGLRLFFLPHLDGIQVMTRYEGDIDTRLRGTPLGLARTALGSREDSLLDRAVEVRGDTETGQLFQEILLKTDWDWEEQLSAVTGDIVAHQVGETVRGTRRYMRDAGMTMRQDISEYIQEEARLAPTRTELQEFLDDVDRLRADTDRLEARVVRLERQPDKTA